MKRNNLNHRNDHEVNRFCNNLRTTGFAWFNYENLDQFFARNKKRTFKVKLLVNCLILSQFSLISYACSPVYSNPTLISQFLYSPGTISNSSLTVFNLKLYFFADDGVTGKELWSYDGVVQPVNVADINPGLPGSYSYGMTVFNSKLYFNAYETTNGNELWAYDGESQPINVADINPGLPGSFPSNFMVFNSKLYFCANDGTNGQELWVYDGNNPPVMVADINPDGDSKPHSLTVFESKLYFSADNGTNGQELWAYDGNNPPVMIANINSQPMLPDYLPWYDPSDLGSSPTGFTNFNSKLYFSANDGINGQELWAYDGGNPPAMIANINPQPTVQYNDYGEDIGFSSPNNFIVFNSKLYFRANDGTNGHELWVYDGSNPPKMVANINPDPYWYYKSNESGSSYPNSLTVFNSNLYFSAFDGDESALWFYDGRNFPTKVDNTSFRPGYLTVFDSDLYFTGASGSQLWVYKLPRLPIPASKSIAPFLYLLLNNTNMN